ncbi:hypothetical protein SAMN05216431_10648 [Ligilactobacillus sp. WC1T17]|uniref:Apolipoprotein N-acyltransferase n=1 Tax=Ligilactobacillus ruminis TaxID=1623 RepID=A0ABY1ABH8_9LACO|nr:hypothetical protein SAMN05216431_10648 [Ligilactobacillus ruminis]
MRNSELSLPRIGWYVAVSLALAFVVPILFVYADVTDINKIAFILYGIYVVYAVFSGLYAGKKNDRFWVLLFFPIVYFIGYRFFFDSYAQYFTLAYLGISYAAYGITKD